MSFFTRLFGGRSKAAPPAEVKWEGQEVHVNPSDAVRKSRNEARIERIKWLLENNPDLPKERKEALEKELNKRLLLKKLQED